MAEEDHDVGRFRRLLIQSEQNNQTKQGHSTNQIQPGYSPRFLASAFLHATIPQPLSMKEYVQYVQFNTALD